MIKLYITSTLLPSSLNIAYGALSVYFISGVSIKYNLSHIMVHISDIYLMSLSDSVPPTIDCGKEQLFFVDLNMTRTMVYWEEPAATDNNDPYPTVVQLGGPRQGQELGVGRYAVTYTSYDDMNNTHPLLSQCTILIKVVGTSVLCCFM